MAPPTPDNAAGSGCWRIFATGEEWFQAASRATRKKCGIEPNEMTSSAGQFESKIPMQILHRPLRTPAADRSRTTAPHPPLPLPQSPGNYPSQPTAEVICRHLRWQRHRDVMEPGHDIIRSEPRLKCVEFLPIDKFPRGVKVAKRCVLAGINCR